MLICVECGGIEFVTGSWRRAWEQADLSIQQGQKLVKVVAFPVSGEPSVMFFRRSKGECPVQKAVRSTKTGRGARPCQGGSMSKRSIIIIVSLALCAGLVGLRCHLCQHDQVAELQAFRAAACTDSQVELVEAIDQARELGDTERVNQLMAQLEIEK